VADVAAQLPPVSVLAASVDGAASAEAGDYPSIEVVRLEEVPGDPITALRSGLERAAGEIVIHLGPGDELLDGAIPRLVAALDSRLAPVAAYPAYRLLDDGGELLETVVPDELDFIEMLRFQLAPAGPAPAFRRAAAIEAIQFDEELGRFEELAFWLRLASRGRLVRVGQPLAARRAANAGARLDGDGVEAGHAWVRAFEWILGEAGLGGEPDRMVTSAARSAFIAAAMQIEPGFNSPGERFFVADRFADCSQESPGADLEAEVAALEAHLANLRQRAVRQRAAVPLLEAAIRDREARLARRRSRLEVRLRRLAKRLLRGPDGV
jgi:hypothetical protein